MKLTATKTPLLIAAMATAITLTGFAPVSAASPIWASADVETAQVIDANFKLKVKKHSFKHHGLKKHSFKHHGYKKKSVSKHHLKKKLALKKFF